MHSRHAAFPALLSPAATDVAPLEAELRTTFGAAMAEMPVRALQLASGATAASARTEAFERAVAVARLLMLQGADPETIAAALISQAITERELDFEAIESAFGAELTALLRGLERAGRIEALSAEGMDLERMRKMLLAIAEDVRVVLVKLAERVVYLRSLTRADEAVQRAAGRQTLELFAPLANRLGVSDIKWELEDFAFRYTEPELYRKIARLLDEKRNDREAYIQRVIAQLEGELRAMGIAPVIQGRPKHIYSIWRKMRGKNVPFERLYDIRAVRVIVANIRECYTVLGVVHDLWTPIEGEFDDYIANPKTNAYRSLHTAVVGPEGRTLEVQIRTDEMHQHSEHGVAAHWRYKEGTRQDRKFDAKIAWLRQVLAWKNEVAGTSADRATRVFDDTIFVLTPQGRVVDLPAGSTPIDFAYHVHTDLGHRCRGAKVDGQMVPLDYKLQNAQRVEIMAVKQGGPSRDWLTHPQYLASPRAQAKVRQWFRHEDYEKDVASGRAALDKELQRLGATSASHEKVAAAAGFAKLDDFFAALGRGEVSSRQVEIAVRGEAPAAPGPAAMPVAMPATARTSSGVLVLGVNNIATLIAKCCKPVPPDPIVGFVTRARGVTVHRQDCPNITSLGPDQRDRLMAADWGNTGTEAPFSADLEVVAVDRQGLLRDISEAISRERINVTAVNTLSRGAHAFMRFTLQVGSADAIVRVIRQVKDVPGVDTARRL